MTDKERTLKNAARYLGMGSPDDGGEPLLRAYDDMLALARPVFGSARAAARVKDGALIIGGMPPIESRALCGLFREAREGLLVLITLGTALDMRVRALMESNPARGVELSACGSAYVDIALDARLRDIAKELKPSGLRLTPRISPGYGDLPLSLQIPLLKAVGADRLGVRLTSGLMMLPEKSVSAIIGIAPEGGGESAGFGCDGGAGCAACKRTDCPFRNE